MAWQWKIGKFAKSFAAPLERVRTKVHFAVCGWKYSATRGDKFNDFHNLSIISARAPWNKLEFAGELQKVSPCHSDSNSWEKVFLKLSERRFSCSGDLWKIVLHGIYIPQTKFECLRWLFGTELICYTILDRKKIHKLPELMYVN